MNLCPVLLINVWEHAYYLKYNNMKSEYIDNFFNVINWSKVEKDITILLIIINKNHEFCKRIHFNL